MLPGDRDPAVQLDGLTDDVRERVSAVGLGDMGEQLVVAGGAQSMSAIPSSAAMTVGQQYGFSTSFAESPG